MNMDINFIERIPFDLDPQVIGELLKLRSRESLMDILEEQIELANNVAVPKAAYFETPITGIDGEDVMFCNETFRSKMLSDLVKVQQKIYPYIITIGMELEEKYQALDDIMEQYILDGVQGVILSQATAFVAKELKEKYGIGEVAFHIPGELDDWDLSEQPKLFRLFGETQNDLGVVLSHSNLMKPTKSVSGVYYEIV
ncbi:hypothetical protein J0B03_00355 [Alkalibacter rhizosphaerae]|uniref:Uncharacterized protein n=1 Tax=Alkalibacter rhizosphaerae TaxID=2815577 RepID=A0A974XEW6_9FIRM|nr:hypothetical protein [Alkalibacter rhizosphaerae]QSX08582.1 hypothetical protein J0B03_00355 [Alkalibacter rhizosphaerae]